MCHNVEQMPTHSHTPTHTQLPFSLPSMPKHHPRATEPNPQESPLETFALLCPQASCTAVLPLPLSLSISLPLSHPPSTPSLSVFFVFLVLRPHTSHTNCASSQYRIFLCFGLSESWPVPEPVTEYQRQFPLPLTQQQQHESLTKNTHKTKLYIAHAKKKKQRKAVKNF